jgi:serine/threonine-protein kinase SRPK3
LKILKASFDHSPELDILAHLAERDTTHAGSAHVLRLLDHFQHTGPNGTHECLITELLGPAVDELLDTPWRKRLESARYPITAAREISRQALAGLAYLHKAGVVHGGMIYTLILPA